MMIDKARESKKEYYNNFYAERDWGHKQRLVKYQLKSYLKIIGIVQKKKSIRNVLDVGCGTGIYTRTFVEIGYRCTGIDFSKTAIRRAREKYPDCSFVQGDATDLKLDDSFDLFFASGFSPFNTDQPDKPKAILDSWSRFLDEEGVILVVGKTDFSGRDITGWRYHTDTEIDRMFGHEGFSVQTFYAHSLLRYVVLAPLFRKFLLRCISSFSKNILGKLLGIPVRSITVLVKK